MNLDLEALETSFDLVAPRGDDLMDDFYARLFATAVGEVLIASMAEIAGPAWSPRYERAWGKAFAIVADAMIEGAGRATVAAAA